MNFKKAKHTFILSDLHLTIPVTEKPKKPMWKKFNQKKFFIDDKFATLLKKATHNINKDIELILAGDIFDFDSVTTIPNEPNFPVSWLETKRGLNSEEDKSVYKIKQIIEHHPLFFKTLHDFISEGNKVVFIIGNHDIELHWNSVQDEIMAALNLEKKKQDLIRFCNWFYISNGDTLVEHGNQYDPYCAVINPINPFYKHPRSSFIRVPFGNLVHRYMVNGMGIFNPHVDTTFLLSFTGYLKFYFNTFRTQPLLVFDWLFGAMATWFISIRDSLMPRIKNPLTLESQYNKIAKDANAEPSMVRTLKELHAHPVSWDIFKIMRILWLDRALLFLILVYCAFQVVSLLHIFWNISFWWTFLAIIGFMPLFLLYVHKLETIRPVTKFAISKKIVSLATRITKVNRMVCGHTHFPTHKIIGDSEYINAGYWSPSFKDPNCSVFEKNKSFVWIKPGFRKREAKLLFWENMDDFDQLFNK